MAIYHLSMQIISRSKGHHAIYAAAYRSGERLFCETTNRTKEYPRDTPPEVFILAPMNTPDWVYDRERLWNEVEHKEKRVDSQLAREMNVALPRELSNREQRELVEEFVYDVFVTRGMIADVGIHRDDPKNPHFHLMLTMRDIDETGFGLKNRSWNPVFANRGTSHDFETRGFVKDADSLVDIRATWADYANRALDRADYPDRIDHRSLEAQGIDRVPTQHLGSSDHEKEKQAKEEAFANGDKYIPVTEYGRLNHEIKKINQEVEKAQSEVISLEKKIAERKEDIRYQLKTNSYWDSLSDVEKVSIQFVSKRMKESATLPLALECKASLNRFVRANQKEEKRISENYSMLKEAKQLYQDYWKAEPRTIEQNRIGRELKRKGFDVNDFKQELTSQVHKLQADFKRNKEQQEIAAEGLEKVNQAIKTLERLTWQSLEQVYGSKVDQIRYLPPEDSYRLLDNYLTTGHAIPFEKVESFISDSRSQKIRSAPTWEGSYNRLNKEVRYLSNWKKKLERLEKEAKFLMKTDPKKAEISLQEIAGERRVLRERIDQLKISLGVVDKVMKSELHKAYPEYDLSNMEMKLVRGILKLNEQEGRTVDLGEIETFEQAPKWSVRGEEQQRMYSEEGMAIMDAISSSISTFLKNDPKANNIHQALENEKRRKIRAKNRSMGMER
ncbi:MobQ family relaxase [Thermoactinomyces sp. DSM 45892]|uniref:MobQ family relaxase n=1 Tax=Thermoactinomyces sp. DSM 45892 TaxID=1882753 RepID=UPI00089CEF04|nr:MobQ family relaxase [Thermoactinomyces sp. DSM 45892]SDY82629.1 MobA/MobL family protein [Thermoactinomyces sp. DSM 45892]